jgi:hypothetical protein
MCASFFAYDYRHERLNARVSDAKPEAHDLLGAALEGFSSTSEMPEIEEAMSLLTGLA